MEKKYEVIMLMREDLKSAGFDATGVTDKQMESLAEEIANAIGNDVFSEVVSDWCIEKKLPELEN